MTNPSSTDRLDRVEAILLQLAQQQERSAAASDARMTRVEEGLDRLEKMVESNNRFLESFSSDLRRYTDSMNNLANRIDGIIATSNQDRLDTNTKLSRIQNKVDAIASHLGVKP